MVKSFGVLNLFCEYLISQFRCEVFELRSRFCGLKICSEVYKYTYLHTSFIGSERIIRPI